MAETVTSKRALALALALATGALALGIALWGGKEPDAASGASHREAPAISLDPPADITDFFMFRSYESGKQDKVILLMDVMSEEPSSGPNYWNFDPSVLYELNIDNDRDGAADDVRFQFRFRTEIRGTVDDADLFLSYVGRPSSPLPPITRLEGPGSEGFGLRQRYSVRMFKGAHDDDGKVLARNLIAVPSNVGPFTMPQYEDLARQGTYGLTGGMRVFAGQRQDPFYIDLGGLFDTFDFRRQPPALTAAEDENDSVDPFGVDMLSGFNVHTIALEVPATLLRRHTNLLGAYASTSRATLTVHGDDGGAKVAQVQRLANPLINEAIIGTEDKDRWNRREPEQERLFRDYYRNPRLALALQLIYGIPAATSGRQDLVDLLLKYGPSDRRLSELLRLNLDVPPRPLADQRRMTVLATPPDPAGWPNGRRPKDDVTDIAIRVVGGPNYTGARAGDGVNTDDAQLTDSFPFLATPADGRNRQHDNP